MTVQEFYKKHKFYPDNRLVKGETILCPTCVKEPAQFSQYGGIIDCTICKEKARQKDAELEKRHGTIHIQGGYPEFVSEGIKEERKRFFNSTLQPWRDGIASKEYAERYPKKAKAIFKNETPKYVYKDLPNWEHRHKTQ